MTNKILIVDDEPDVLQVVERGLSALGFSVITANNGSNAVALALELRPDLIVLDVLMSDMDGGEVARKLQELTETKDIPIIFLTGMFPKRKGEHGLRMIDGNVVLDKPYEIGELFIAIKKLLKEKRPAIN
jgi:CheY-like chemotaxis protein